MCYYYFMAEKTAVIVLLEDVVARLGSVVVAVHAVELNVATLTEQVRGLQNGQSKMVSRSEFSPVKTTVFGLVSAVGFAIVAGIANFFFNN